MMAVVHKEVGYHKRLWSQIPNEGRYSGDTATPLSYLHSAALRVERVVRSFSFSFGLPTMGLLEFSCVVNKVYLRVGIRGL
jgi:hypothetical protein